MDIMVRKEEEESRTPRKWDSKFVDMVYRLCLLGLTDKELAVAFNVDRNTIDYWKRTKPEFLEAMTRGKLIVDGEVAEKLLQSALGYEYQEEVAHVCDHEVVITSITRYCKPNPWAQVKWLSLRRRSNWSETHKVQVTNTNINANLNFDDLSVDELKMMASIAMKNRSNQEDVGDNG